MNEVEKRLGKVFKNGLGSIKGNKSRALQLLVNARGFIQWQCGFFAIKMNIPATGVGVFPAGDGLLVLLPPSQLHKGIVGEGQFLGGILIPVGVVVFSD